MDNFFKAGLSKTYYVTSVRTFIFGEEIEMLFKMISDKSDIVLTAYATLTRSNIYPTDNWKCVCRSDIVGYDGIKISDIARSLIRQRVEPLALSLGALLLDAEVGGYGEISFNT